MKSISRNTRLRYPVSEVGLSAEEGTVCAHVSSAPFHQTQLGSDSLPTEGYTSA